MIKKLLAFMLLIPAMAWGQYLSVNLDTQLPAQQQVIDHAFSGNSFFIRAYIYESGVPLDMSAWTVLFRYSYGQYDTNGMVTIPGTVYATNRIDFATTNVFALPKNNYYWSISGSDLSGHIKTFGVGTMKVVYDPATSTNLVTLMQQINMNFWSNNVGQQVLSNTINIANLTATFNSTSGQVTTALGTLTTNLASEVIRATNAEYIISNAYVAAIAVETSRATNAETVVSNAIAGAVAVETTRATNAEAVLQGEITAMTLSTGTTDNAAIHTNQIGPGLNWDGSVLTATNSGGGGTGTVTGVTIVGGAADGSTTNSGVVSLTYNTNGIVGPAGSNGAPGAAGSDGTNGLNGSNGLAATISIAWTSNGLAGSSAFVTNAGDSNAASLGFIIPVGSNGATGPQGTQGIQGIQGPQGTQGIQGIQGPAGSNGVDGAQGPPGSNGVQGIQGIPGPVTNQIMDFNGVLYRITNAPPTTGKYVIGLNPANSTAWFAAESAGTITNMGNDAVTSIVWIASGGPQPVGSVTTYVAQVVSGYVPTSNPNLFSTAEKAFATNKFQLVFRTNLVVTTNGGIIYVDSAFNNSYSVTGDASIITFNGTNYTGQQGFSGPGVAQVPGGFVFSGGGGDISSTQIVTRILTFADTDFSSLIGTNDPDDEYQFFWTVATNAAFTGTTLSIQSTNTPANWSYWNGATVETMQTGYLPHGYLNSYSARVYYTWTNSIRGATYYCRGYLILSDPPTTVNIVNKVLEAK